MRNLGLAIATALLAVCCTRQTPVGPDRPPPPAPPVPVCAPDQISDMQCVQPMRPATPGLCPQVYLVHGVYDSVEAPIDVPWTDYRRKLPFGTDYCCYRWCASLPAEPSDTPVSQELQCSDLYPRGEECLDVLSGPSQFPASSAFPECPAALAGFGSKRPEVMGPAQFSPSTTYTARREQGRPNACCYAFCQTIPGVSFE